MKIVLPDDFKADIELMIQDRVIHRLWTADDVRLFRQYIIRMWNEGRKQEVISYVSEEAGKIRELHQKVTEMCQRIKQRIAEEQQAGKSG